MEIKKILAIVSSSMVLLASFALVAPVYGPGGTYSYKVMGGVITSSTQMGEPGGVGIQYDVSYWDIPFSPPRNASPYVTPAVGGYDITFGSPDGNGVVPLTVPASSWTSFWHSFYNIETGGYYFNLTVLMNDDGYGWLYTQANADVDVITYNNDTGVFWLSGSEADELVLPPDVGSDGVAGTGDAGDGFGDGDLDPAGSSILWLNLTLHVTYYDPGEDDWILLFDAPWPCLMTTETASDVVNEPNSDLDGASTGNLVGAPWMYLKDGEPWENDKSNYYAKYVAAWSVLNIPVWFLLDMHLDVLFKWEQLLLREDVEVDSVAGTQTGYQYLMGDGTANFPAGSYPPGSLPDWKVGWQDLFSLAAAYGSEDEGFGPPANQEADSNYDARFDLTSTFGGWDSKIGWQDLFALAGNYGNAIKGP